MASTREEILLEAIAVAEDEKSVTSILYTGRLTLTRKELSFSGTASTGKWIAPYTMKGDEWYFSIPLGELEEARVEVSKRLKLKKRLHIAGYTHKGEYVDVSFYLDRYFVQKYVLASSIAKTLMGRMAESYFKGVIMRISDTIIDELADIFGETVASVKYSDPYKVWEVIIKRLKEGEI